jgi:hypothetical protein
MRALRIPALLALACVLVAAPAHSADRDQAAFEKLKSLEGVWEAKGSNGMPMQTTFKVIAGGTAVMEEMSVENMVNVYHPDGDTVMVTHYCAGNNQPRLVASGLSADGRTLSFVLRDVTNKAGAKASIMDGLKLTFQDADHLTQEWDSSGDKNAPHMVATYQRKK